MVHVTQFYCFILLRCAANVDIFVLISKYIMM